MTSGGMIAGEAKVKTPDKMKSMRDKRGVLGGNHTPSFQAALYQNHIIPDGNKRDRDDNKNKISVNYMGK